MIHESNNHQGKSVSGIIAECDCCGRFLSKGGIAASMSELFKTLSDAKRKLDIAGWICMGNHVICEGCQLRIRRDEVEMKFIDKSSIVHFPIFGSGDKPRFVDLDTSDVSYAKITDMMGDEVLEVHYKDGKKRVFDSGENRAIDVEFESYPVYDSDIGINLFKDSRWMKSWSSEVHRVRAIQLMNAI